MSPCRRMRPWIVRSADGDLEPKETLRLAKHLASCTPCRIVLARETRLAALLESEAEAVGVDESFFRSVMASLPECPPKPAAAVSRTARWRRGLRLATWGTVVALGAEIAARLLPSLRVDIATPAMPRFTPDDTDGLISLIGSAAQWVRMTAQSIAWAGSSPGAAALTVGALSAGAVLMAAAGLLAVSGALAWAARGNSRAS